MFGHLLLSPVIIFPLLLIFLQSPLPSSISTSEQKKQSIITPPLFAADWDPSEPIIVLLVLSLAASFVSGWLLLGIGGARPAVSLPACLPPSCPVALLSGVGFKGKETFGFTHSSITWLKRLGSHFININMHKYTWQQCDWKGSSLSVYVEKAFYDLNLLVNNNNFYNSVCSDHSDS